MEAVVRPSSTIDRVFRHSLTVRVTHWANVLILTILLLSGLQIFNAHPMLHWGQAGADSDPAIVRLEAVERGDGLTGVTHIGSLSIPTTGVLGASADSSGDLEARGFPSWLTIPSYQDLSAGRRWHFFFAWAFVINGLLYLVYGIFAGHLRKDLVPDKDQLEPSHLAREIVDHSRLRFPKGAEAKRYNALQKITYLVVVLVLLPAMLASGLTMSPAVDAALPWLLDLFGGRQSARTVHFLTACLLVLFVIVHIAMVLASGFWNNIRSMITGRYDIHVEERPS
jgi:thiosulfate reductase cytochrome b subunit